MVIDGCGAELMFFDRVTPFMLTNCKHVTLRNFTIDFAFARYCQGTVTRSDAEGHIGFRCADEIISTREMLILLANKTFGKTPCDYILREMRSMARRICRQAYWKPMLGVWMPTMCGLFFVTDPAVPSILWGKHFSSATSRVRMSISFWMGVRTIRVENVRMYRGGGMGIVAHTSRDVELAGVRIEPRPGRGECRSTTADGMYFVQCCGRVHIHDCTITDTMDDALNIHGIYTRVETVKSPDTIIARIGFDPHTGICPFAVGCEIAVIDGQSHVERTRVRVLSLDRLDDTRTCLRLDRPMTACVGDYIESILAAEFIFEDNTVARCPHLRISDPGKKMVRRNRFEEINAIVVDDLMDYWYESGPVTDLLMGDNDFDHCPRVGDAYAISIRCPCGRTTDARHRGIRIRGNRFDNASGHAVWVEHAEDVTIADNRFSNPERALHTENCAAVTRWSAGKETSIHETLSNERQPLLRDRPSCGEKCLPAYARRESRTAPL